eukprot:6440892-Ditylum_brightwellii.AAC.1
MAIHKITAPQMIPVLATTQRLGRQHPLHTPQHTAYQPGMQEFSITPLQPKLGQHKTTKAKTWTNVER